MTLNDPRLWFSYKGRINRQPYFFASAILGASAKGLEAAGDANPALAIAILALFLGLIYMLMAVAVKRAHDVGKGGWFAALLFVPLLNLWPGLTFTFQKGTEGANEYGEDPLAAPAPVPAAT